MKKPGLYTVVIGLLFNCFYPFLSYGEQEAVGNANQSHLQSNPMVHQTYIDDREIYESFFKEGQVALAAYKACGEFDVVREVRNTIAESSLDPKTKSALLDAFDKKLVNLEKKALERKNNLAHFRKQQREDALLILSFFIPAMIITGSIIVLAGSK